MPSSTFAVAGVVLIAVVAGILVVRTATKSSGPDNQPQSAQMVVCPGTALTVERKTYANAEGGWWGILSVRNTGHAACTLMGTPAYSEIYVSSRPSVSSRSHKPSDIGAEVDLSHGQAGSFSAHFGPCSTTAASTKPIITEKIVPVWTFSGQTSGVREKAMTITSACDILPIQVSALRPGIMTRPVGYQLMPGHPRLAPMLH